MKNEIFNRTETVVRPYQLKEKIKNIMWKYVGPIRDKGGLEKAIAELKSIQSNDLPDLSLGYRQLKYNRERMEVAEVRLMIKTALLVANAALQREESRGAHFRQDFPLQNDEDWLKYSVAEKNKNGDAEISFKAVRG